MFSLDGMTLHAAFDFSFNGKAHEGLSEKKLAQFRNNLADLKLVIIDEMSMVDCNKLYKIHRRLCEVFQCLDDDLFANVGIVLVGDLLQVCLLMKTILPSYLVSIEFFFSLAKTSRRSLYLQATNQWSIQSLTWCLSSVGVIQSCCSEAKLQTGRGKYLDCIVE